MIAPRVWGERQSNTDKEDASSQRPQSIGLSPKTQRRQFELHALSLYFIPFSTSPRGPAPKSLSSNVAITVSQDKPRHMRYLVIGISTSKMAAVSLKLRHLSGSNSVIHFEMPRHISKTFKVTQIIPVPTLTNSIWIFVLHICSERGPLCLPVLAVLAKGTLRSQRTGVSFKVSQPSGAVDTYTVSVLLFRLVEGNKSIWRRGTATLNPCSSPQGNTTPVPTDLCLLHARMTRFCSSGPADFRGPASVS